MLDPGFYNMDCVEAMKQFPDKYFDLAIVDPPYGDGNGDVGGVQPIRREGRALPQIPGTGSGDCSTGTSGGVSHQNANEPEEPGRRSTVKKIIAWDVAPGREYFDELFRVSRNQIIWGGNYFDLPPTRCFLIWRKLTISESFSMAMCEYAWTSFNENAKWFECAPQGTTNEQRFHPTQKPVKLYSWILNNYAKPGDKILDTHVGSASSLVACHKAGFENVWGFEIDEGYYQQALARLIREKQQISMFEFM